MVVVAYIEDISIATERSLQAHHEQVSKIVQLLMEKDICIKIDKCVFDAPEVTFLGFVVSGSGLRMDSQKARAFVNWPKPTSRKEVQQPLG